MSFTSAPMRCRVVLTARSVCHKLHVRLMTHSRTRTHPSRDSNRLRSTADPQSLTHAEAIREVKRLQATLETMRNPRESSLPHSLLAEVSHELRTPITGIVKLAEVLSETAVGDQAKRYAGLIEKSGRQLEQTVQAVLSLAKLEEEETALECRPLNVPDEVRPVFDSFRPLAESKGLSYSLTVEETNSPLCASLHSGALSSVVQNLLSNAIKYTEAGSVHVAIRAVTEPDGPVVEIEVSDSGVGMSESYLTELFDRFTQESTPADTFSNGVGLGLTLVKRFTDRMGGSVDVETKKDEGSRFVVRFPRVARESMSSERFRGANTAPEPSAKEILLIASDSNAQRAIRTLIEDRWDCTSACSFTEGLRLVNDGQNGSRRPFDLILLGIERGERFSEPDLLRRLEERTNGHDVPILALAHGDRTVPGHLALDGYIIEPFRSSNLVTEIARYLRS